MAEAKDYVPDIGKYTATVNEAAVKGIVHYCGIALRNRDSSLVSASDPAEIARVRDNFLKKKLQLSQQDHELDQAVTSVMNQMKAEHSKSRVTVYYPLAEKFGKLGQFG